MASGLTGWKRIVVFDYLLFLQIMKKMNVHDSQRDIFQSIDFPNFQWHELPDFPEPEREFKCSLSEQ